MMKRLAIVLLVLLMPLLASAQTPAPAIFFTDIDSGPNTGNTDSTFSASGNGAYVTLYGNFFGATQGASTVTWNGQNCLTVLPATGAYTGWGMSYLWYQKIIVQIGATCTPGTGQFVVTVGAQASGCADTAAGSAACLFTVRALSTNHIYFIVAGGSDAAAGTFAAPLATLLGCVNKMIAGDICYGRGGGAGLYQNSGSGFNAVMLITTSGTVGKPLALGSYPGATPQPKVGCTSNQSQCSSDQPMQYGFTNRNIGNPISFWTVFGINFHHESGAAGIGLSSSGTNDRFIGNQIQCPRFNDVSGCFATNEVGRVYLLGNEVTNTGIVGGPSQKQSHAVYFSSDSNHIWAAFNYIHDNTTCRATQFHSSPLGGGGAGDPTGHDQFDLHWYNNTVLNERCDGVNFATVDPSQGGVEAFNNVLIHIGTGLSSDGGGDFAAFVNPSILNTGPAPPATPAIQVYNNSAFDVGSVGASDPNGVHGAIGNVSPPNAVYTNNVFKQLTGQLYLQAVRQAGLSGSKNNWFGTTGTPAMFTSNLTVDPLFTSTTDLHLLTGSPMIGVGVASWGTGTAPLYDHDGLLRPSPPSVGAYEFTSAAGAPSVQLSVASLSFGAQTVGSTSAAQNVTLTNNGTASLTITSIALTGANAADFAISSNPCGSTLGISASCIVGVTFTPTVAGARSASLTFTTNAASSPNNVTLSGTGGLPIALFNPTSTAFGGVKLGQSSLPVAISLTNTGNGTMNISSISMTGANPGDFSQNNNCGASLAVSASCIINVTFTPLSPIARATNLSVASNAATSPNTMSLTGSGLISVISGTGSITGNATVTVHP